MKDSSIISKYKIIDILLEIYQVHLYIFLILSITYFYYFYYKTFWISSNYLKHKNRGYLSQYLIID